MSDPSMTHFFYFFFKHSVTTYPSSLHLKKKLSKDIPLLPFSNILYVVQTHHLYTTLSIAYFRKENPFFLIYLRLVCAHLEHTHQPFAKQKR